MKNIIDYAKTQLNTISIEKFNPVDSLILSMLSYIILDGLVSSIDNNGGYVTFRDLLKTECFSKMFDTIPYGNHTKELLFYVASSPRFRDIKINYHTSQTSILSEKQFSATTFILDDNLAYIAFRGTDYSVVGWKEDFNMAFTSPIPSQLEGVKYLNKIGELIPHNLYIGGHSKGGNIAIFAAMNCNPLFSSRIINIFSHDGPGFSEEIIESNSFIKIKDKINKTLPYSSLIGILLENYNEYYIIKSNKFGGLKQHNPYSWEVKDSDFVYLEKLSYSSEYTYTTLHQLLKDLDNEKRKMFIEGIFSIINDTKVESFVDITNNWRENVPLILGSIRHLDKEIKDLIIEFIKEFSVIYFKTIIHIDKKK